jgi:toxin ParE1/3/4
VVWTDGAIAALEAIGAYIERDNPLAAARWVEKLIAAAELVAVSPRGGRVVPELGREDVRETFLRAYRIVYQLRRRDIRILAIFEGHRRFPPDVEPEPGAG